MHALQFGQSTNYTRCSLAKAPITRVCQWVITCVPFNGVKRITSHSTANHAHSHREGALEGIQPYSEGNDSGQ